MGTPPLDLDATNLHHAYAGDGLMQGTGTSAKSDLNHGEIDTHRLPAEAEPRALGRTTGGLHADMNETGKVSSHERHDRRSLALHVEAVRVLQAHPELAQRVLDVLDNWEAVADPHSKTLRDEWRHIVEGKLWALAIEPSERGNQLRQASPLGFVLDPCVRERISRGFPQTR